MELNNINNKGSWSEIAAALNQNFLKILAELLKYQHVTTISGANFLGYFTSSSVLPNPAEAAWAVAGDLKAVTVYAYYTSDAVPNGFSAGWNALSSLGTYDFTDYSELLTKVEETGAKVSELGQKKQNKIKSLVDSITDSLEDSIEVLDDSGNIIVKIKKDSVNVKCLTVGGKEILLKDFLDRIMGVEDVLEVEESVKIFNNDNELIFEINNDGVNAKSIKLINGETLSPYNVLSGKKWVVVGDSFSTNADESITSDSYIETGKYKGKLKDYGYIIGSRNNMDIVDFHAGGKTIAYPVSGNFSNSFCNPNSSYTKAYKDIPLDADYITIQLGINDQSHMIQYSGDGEDTTGLITLGTIDSKDISTFYGAWNTAIEWILTNLPFVHVGIIITNGLGNSNGSWNDTGNDYDAKKLYEAEIAIAERWGIPYLDLNGDARCPMMHRGYNPKLCNEAIQLRLSAFTEGAYGTHPNSKAYEYESTFIENFLRSI